MKIRTIAAGEFKAKCLALMDEIAASGEEIVITKRGRPVARLKPECEPEIPDLRGSILYEDEDAWKPLGVSWVPRAGKTSTLVLDTHCFYRWRTEHRRLSRTAQQAIERADHLLVSDIVCWEIAFLVGQNRLSLDRPTRTWLELALDHPKIELVPISPEIAIAAVSLNNVMNRDPVDGLIAATALRLGWPLVTRDTDIKDFAAIETIW